MPRLTSPAGLRLGPRPRPGTAAGPGPTPSSAPRTVLQPGAVIGVDDQPGPLPDRPQGLVRPPEPAPGRDVVPVRDVDHPPEHPDQILVVVLVRDPHLGRQVV